MSTIITGKNGYIASHLKAVIKDARCVSFRNGADGVDLTDADALIHCAAIVHKKEKDYADFYDRVNHIETVKLAKKAKENGVSHFVFMSTMSVYGVKCGVIDKNTPCNPISLYGKSKLSAENEILAMEDENFTVTVLRPPMVYGPDCPGNFALLKRLALAIPIFPKVANKRSMIYVINLAYAVKMVLDDKTSGIILPMDKEYVNTSDMVKKISDAVGKKIILSNFMGKIAASIPLGIFQKVFGSLYYDKAGAMLCDSVSFDEAIRLCVTDDAKQV